MTHTRAITLFFVLFSVTFLPSCYLINFSRDVDINVSYDISNDSLTVYQQYLWDANKELSDFSQYHQYIEEFEIVSMECYLTSFTGPGTQRITGGTLSIADENGEGPVILTRIPDEYLENIYLHGVMLEPEDEGVRRIEDLILNSPNRCMSILQATVNEVPVNFSIQFRIKATIRGSLI